MGLFRRGRGAKSEAEHSEQHSTPAAAVEAAFLPGLRGAIAFQDIPLTLKDLAEHLKAADNSSSTIDSDLQVPSSAPAEAAAGSEQHMQGSPALPEQQPAALDGPNTADSVPGPAAGGLADAISLSQARTNCTPELTMALGQAQQQQTLSLTAQPEQQEFSNPCSYLQPSADAPAAQTGAPPPAAARELTLLINDQEQQQQQRHISPAAAPTPSPPAAAAAAHTLRVEQQERPVPCRVQATSR
jgi:hypothetical protein